MSKHRISVSPTTWQKLQELVAATHMNVEDVLSVAVECAHNHRDELAEAIAELEAGWADYDAKQEARDRRLELAMTGGKL